MSLILLHDPNNADSAAFLALFGSSGQVIEGHAECVAFMPNLRGFPSVAYKGHILFNPPDMDAVAAWCAGIDNPPAPARPALTNLEFLRLFTDEELVRLKTLEASSPLVALFWELYRAADSIHLTDERVVNGLRRLEADGHLTAGRAAKILAGEAPA